NGTLIQSADGQAWSDFTPGANSRPTGTIQDFVFQAGSPLCVLTTGTGLFTKASSGAPWTAVNSAPSLNRVLWVGNEFVGVGPNGVRSSTSGTSWTTPSGAPTGALLGINNPSGSDLIVVGPGPGIFTRTSGTWADHSAGAPSGVNLRDVVVNGSTAVAVGQP